MAKKPAKNPTKIPLENESDVPVTSEDEIESDSEIGKTVTACGLVVEEVDSDEEGWEEY